MEINFQVVVHITLFFFFSLNMSESSYAIVPYELSTQTKNFSVFFVYTDYKRVIRVDEIVQNDNKIFNDLGKFTIINSILLLPYVGLTSYTIMTKI